MRLDWTAPQGEVADYVLIRDGQVIGLPTTPGFVDHGQNPWRWHSYRLVARNDAAQASRSITTGTGVPTLAMGGGAVMLIGAGGVWLWWRRKRRG